MIRRTLISILLVLSIYQQGVAQSTYLFEIGVPDSLYSDTLMEMREIWVQLPENYTPESQLKYPVIYLLDGGVHLNAASTVLGYYWGGFMPEMIVVGISNRENRTRDLTTSVIETQHGMEFRQKTGNAENFTSFIEQELIPFIESKYPATGYRTLIGHSYAGLFTINMLLNHSELFANYIAIDPSLDWDNQKLLKQTENVLISKNFKGKSLFMSMSGQLHMQHSEITIDNVMQDTSDYTLFARSIIEFANSVGSNPQNELNFKWKFYPQDLHGTVVLPSILDGLIYLFDWYPIEQTELFNSPDTPEDELVNLIRSREKKLKDHFGYFVPPLDEELLTMLGYMNLDWGELQKSFAFFQLAVEYFPKSSSAYDSLADYYEAQDDFENALKNVIIAYELSGDDQYKNRMEKLKKKI